MSDEVRCIDISHWQGFPDFAKVKAAGVIAMIHKATEGTSYVDPNRAKNVSNAMAAGIKCCTYHWIKPGNPKQQIAHFLTTIDPVPGERMVIDYEEDGCSLENDLKPAVQALLDDPRKLQITVYSGHLLKEQLGSRRDDFLAEHTDLWLAQYTTGTPTWPTATFPKWTLWQYSETGSINGISGSAVDLNRFNGTDAELLKWIAPSGAAPGPSPSPDPKLPVHLNISAPAGVAISIGINGELVYGEET